MPTKLDSYLGVHATALKLRSQRTEVLAANLANADTPNYRARDIDFKSALAQAGAPGSGVHLATTRAGVEWAIAHGKVYDFLGHPSCLGVVDPEFRVIDLICDLVDASHGRAAIVDLDTIARRAV